MGRLLHMELAEAHRGLEECGESGCRGAFVGSRARAALGLAGQSISGTRRLSKVARLTNL
jgi:hypothetical protein